MSLPSFERDRSSCSGSPSLIRTPVVISSATVWKGPRAFTNASWGILIYFFFKKNKFTIIKCAWEGNVVPNGVPDFLPRHFAQRVEGGDIVEVPAICSANSIFSLSISLIFVGKYVQKIT